MKSSRVAVLLLAIAAVVAVAALRGGGGGGGSGPGGSPKAPKGALRIVFNYSPEKEILLKPLIEEFNARHEQVGGKAVFVEGTPSSSGDDEAKLAKGSLELTAWSPASSLWGRLLNYEADKKYVADTNPSIVRTPLVIAMWEPMARTLGYPGKPLGFDDILKLARSPQGWAAYGRPEFGPFKLVHTNPDFSTSGLSAVVAEYYSAIGKREGLSVADVTNATARNAVKAIEQSIVHYGDTTLFIADQMRKEGMGYASAVAMEEATLLDFNRHRGSQPKLIAVYPKEGTFYSDSPFIVLDAPWVTDAEKQGAAAFQKFLAGRITPELAAKSGFRSPDPNQKPVAPISAALGADPAQPTRVLGLPEPQVLAKIKSTWRADRKPANVLLVIDVSGSMSEENKLEQAKRGLLSFLREVAPQDRVGLTSFSTDITPLVPIAPIRDNIDRLRQTVSVLTADGETTLYDATAAAVDQVRKIIDTCRINAVV
ncbi:MAG: Ca-activated chloride channel, partial [Solirubrobacteraceae bacterium]|nr:Ca-activated chloride channel [Solirubrobacteraceae bacterium]